MIAIHSKYNRLFQRLPGRISVQRLLS